MNKEGSLSINSENIFPIIKKWLYSDHDIFFRELVSNGCDAVTKLKKLDMIGEYTIPEGKELCVKVTADAETKTITFTDNGIGMDANEIDQYINHVISLTSIRIRQMMIRLLVTLVLAFTQHLWLLTV